MRSVDGAPLLESSYRVSRIDMVKAFRRLIVGDVCSFPDRVFRVEEILSDQLDIVVCTAVDHDTGEVVILKQFIPKRPNEGIERMDCRLQYARHDVFVSAACALALDGGIDVPEGRGELTNLHSYHESDRYGLVECIDFVFSKEWDEMELDETDHLKVAIIVAEILDLLYQQNFDFVHADIKPNNILVDKEGADLLVHLFDFNVSRSKYLTELEKQLPRKADVHCMTPLEQYRGMNQLCEKSDVFSLATTLLTLLQGDAFFAFPNEKVKLVSIRNKLAALGFDEEAIDLFVRALSARKDQRPTMAEFRDGLRAYLARITSNESTE